MNVSNKTMFILDILAMVLWAITTVFRFMEGDIMMGIIYIAMTCMWGALAALYWKKYQVEKKK